MSQQPTTNNRPPTPPAVLTIAGSDSGGGAGIQADLRTFTAFGTFGTTVITCITAQNPDTVAGVEAVSPAMVALQIKTVCAGFRIAAAKTGMLYSAPIIRVVARTVKQCRIPRLVVDPVMVATSGARLLKPDAISVLCRELLPVATVITPNCDEAEILCGFRITSLATLSDAAQAIGDRFHTACLAKGGHLVGKDVVDVLYDGTGVTVFDLPRVRARTHGTGCTLSAALTASLATGHSLVDAVCMAKAYVRDRLHAQSGR